MKRFLFFVILLAAGAGAWMIFSGRGNIFSIQSRVTVAGAGLSQSPLSETESPPVSSLSPLVTPPLQDMKDIFERAILPYTHAPITAPMITGNKKIDQYIVLRTQIRGYILRPLADEFYLVSFEGKRVQSVVSDAVTKMQTDATKEGMTITFVSGYRSVDDQRKIFLNKLGTVSEDDVLSGKKDALLDSILKVSSPPGYSKHHTGYAMDIGCTTYELSNAFMQTPCYIWLSENNFSRARSYGFIPSYPTSALEQGPNPESWEFVWVPGDVLP